MSIIIPSSRLAAPSRPIIRPGWDDAPIDRPRRRSAWWRQLLSGAAGLTRLQPGVCCGCTTGHACGTCAGIPDTLTFSYTFQARFVACADFSSSCTLTWNGISSWVGVMSMPDCASCGLGAPGWTTFRAAFSCGGGSLALGFPDFGSACSYPATGTGAVGTFTCSPMLWVRSDAGSGCPTACDFGSTGDMFLKWNWTVSA